MLIMTKEPFGAVVNRKDIFDRLDYQQNEYGNRAFESMIYRLRHKIEAIGEPMPIKTYRGVGYSLSLPIICIWIQPFFPQVMIMIVLVRVNQTLKWASASVSVIIRDQHIMKKWSVNLLFMVLSSSIMDILRWRALLALELL